MSDRPITLVTGGAGFIGSHLARALLRRGRQVLVADNLSTGYAHNVPPGATLVEADLSREDAVARLPWSHVAAVFHLAAQSSGPVSKEIPLRDLDTNARGTLLLLDACARHGVPRFLYASSMAAYGNAGAAGPVREDTPLRPLSFYGISKQSAEAYVAYFGRHGLATTVFRMFSVYGPGQDLANLRQGMLSIYLKYLLDRRPLVVTGSGDRFRDFVYIDDVVSAWLAALDRPRAYGRTYNLGSGRATTVAALIALLLRHLGLPPDYPVQFQQNDPDDQRGLVACIDALRTELGWQPQFDLAAGLRELLRALGREPASAQ